MCTPHVPGIRHRLQTMPYTRRVRDFWYGFQGVALYATTVGTSAMRPAVDTNGAHGRAPPYEKYFCIEEHQPPGLPERMATAPLHTH